MQLSLRQRLVWVLAGLLSTILALPAHAEYAPPILTEYPVPGSPERVAVEAPGRIWFTLPAANQIGSLVIGSAGDYQITLYVVPSADAAPNDIRYTDGTVWFSEPGVGQIGRLNVAGSMMDEFALPGSQPHGIDTVPGNPGQVWFADAGGDRLARLTVTDTLSYSFATYPMPAIYAGAHPEDVHVQAADYVWFTAPGVARIGRLRLLNSGTGWNLAWVPTDSTSQGGTRPWSISVDASGYPWFTERTFGKIGQYFPSTISLINWRKLSQSSGPDDIAVGQGKVWFTERGADRVGEIEPSSTVVNQLYLPGRAPSGLALDAAGCVWIGESGADQIARWCAPYFQHTYLPQVIEN
jgi:virginiamycin B lyase